MNDLHLAVGKVHTGYLHNTQDIEGSIASGRNGLFVCLKSLHTLPAWTINLFSKQRRRLTVSPRPPTAGKYGPTQKQFPFKLNIARTSQARPDWSFADAIA